MARLITPAMMVSMAIKARTEGMGVRATGRVLEKSHSTISRWEQRLAAQVDKWSPAAPVGAEVTIEGDEVYTRVGENIPPAASEGWTIHFIERESRYWVGAKAGIKNAQLFGQGVKSAWDWASPCESIRWFTDRERRYGKELWKLASLHLKQSETTSDYPYRKVWRKGLEVAIKIKGSQGRPRVEWVKAEHPLTAISDKSDVHANHNEAQNAALRRRSSAYRRRQNLYAKRVEGLQRVLDVQRLIHNWVKPHWDLGNCITPSMAMGYSLHPFSIVELLTHRGFFSVSP